MASEHDAYLRTEIELHEKLASVYTDKRYRPEFSMIFQRHWNRRMIEISGLEAGATVLDYGCGTGILFPELAEHGLNIVGLDLSHAMLTSAPDDPGAMRICAVGCAMPIPDGTFDAVFCRGSIHHLPDLGKCFEEVARVLKDDGCLVFSEPSNDSIVNRLARAWMYADSDEFHEEDEGFRRAELEPLLRDVGFEVEYSRGFGFFAYTFAGFPDKLNLLSRLPGAGGLTRLMIGLDNMLERIPYLHTWALHWQVRARKA